MNAEAMKVLGEEPPTMALPYTSIEYPPQKIRKKRKGVVSRSMSHTYMRFLKGNP